MEIIDYGMSQVVYLHNAFRPSGAAFFPEIAGKVINRYQFAKTPTLDDLNKEALKFEIGKFRDVQIAEFAVYNDGVIAKGKCPTETLEDFLKDILTFTTKELGLVPILEHRDEVHLESHITVKSKSDLGAFISPPAVAIVQKIMAVKIPKMGIPMQPSGVIFDYDLAAVTSRRKPARVFIERKVGFKFEENLFACIAPLGTQDHLELLTALEREAGK